VIAWRNASREVLARLDHTTLRLQTADREALSAIDSMTAQRMRGVRLRQFHTAVWGRLTTDNDASVRSLLRRSIPAGAPSVARLFF
jgi:hypothetical protein